MAFGFLKKIKLKTILKVISIASILAKKDSKEKEVLRKAKEILDEAVKS